jgi:polar amino acid transport system ATP-binding protein
VTVDALLKVDGLALALGGHTVLDRVTFAIGSGEVLAVIGASGAGKTSLLKCINLLLRPDRGTLSFGGTLYFSRAAGDGPDSVPVDPSLIRKRIGMVFQEWNLWPNRTVLENVAEGPRYVLGMRRDQANTIAEQCCRRVGLHDKLERYPQRLSGGEKQRAAVARALAMRPELLMLDEVTAALDPSLVAEVLDVIADIAQEGRTIIVVTHHIGFARATADRVAYLHRGQFLETGAATELLSEPSTPELRAFLGKLDRLK